MLDKVNWKVGEIWQIKAIEPDHGAGTIFAVIVPVPRGREDDISSLHLDALAMDSSESPLALNNESHCKGRVAMSLSGLIGHDELEPGIDGVGGERGIFSTRLVCQRMSKKPSAPATDIRVVSPRDGFTSMSTRLSA